MATVQNHLNCYADNRMHVLPGDKFVNSFQSTRSGQSLLALLPCCTSPQMLCLYARGSHDFPVSYPYDLHIIPVHTCTGTIRICTGIYGCAGIQCMGMHMHTHMNAVATKHEVKKAYGILRPEHYPDGMGQLQNPYKLTFL